MLYSDNACMAYAKQPHGMIFMSAFLVLAAIGIYGIVPQIDGFSLSLTILSNADFRLVAGAAAFGLGAVACSACVYRLLARRRISYARTLLVQLSGLFVNRLLPAGIGGLSLNFLYLRGQRHTRTEASAVVLLNNVVGIVGHSLLLLVAVITLSLYKLQLAVVPIDSRLLWALVGGPMLIIIGLFAAKMFIRTKPKLIKQIKAILKFYHNRPYRLLCAVIMSSLLTVCNAVALWLCCRSLSIDVSLVAIFVVFSFGIALGAVTPTPGGLGGVEAGMVAGLVALNIPAATSLAAVLLFRLITFWLGLAIGLAALIVVRRLRLVLL